jgi:hypothetical protein
LLPERLRIWTWRNCWPNYAREDSWFFDRLREVMLGRAARGRAEVSALLERST